MSDLILFFDTETTGLPNFKKPLHDPSQPKLLQLGAILTPDGEEIVDEINTLVQIGRTPIHPKAQEAHGISAEKANSKGIDPAQAYDQFYELAMQAEAIVCHNHNFDFKLIELTAAQLCHRSGSDEPDLMLSEIRELPYYCTMVQSKEFCALPMKGRNGYKFPKLMELYQILFNEQFEGAHDAMADVTATMKCFFELKKRGVM